jgi:hypothetical protein
MDPSIEERWHDLQGQIAGSESFTTGVWQGNKDLTFMFKTLHGFYDLDAFDFVSFVNHSRTRNCNNPSLVLKVPSCKSSTFQTSFFNRIVPLWNHTCKIAPPRDLRSLATFISFLSRTYFNLLSSSFDVDMCCTWSLYRSCSCHRNS